MRTNVILRKWKTMFVAALGRSNSTPGLVETKGQVPLEEMWVSPVEPEKPTILTASTIVSRVPTGPLPGGSAAHQHANPATSNSSLHSSEEDKSNKTGGGMTGLTPKINFYTSGKQFRGQIYNLHLIVFVCFILYPEPLYIYKFTILYKYIITPCQYNSYCLTCDNIKYMICLIKTNKFLIRQYKFSLCYSRMLF